MKVVYKWVKPDIPTTRLLIIWLGFPNTGVVFSQGRSKKRQNVCLRSEVLGKD